MRFGRLAPPKCDEFDPTGGDRSWQGVKAKRKRESHNKRVIEQRKRAAEAIGAWLQVWAK